MISFADYLKEIRLIGTDTGRESKPHSVDSWYDKKTRQWVVQVKDKEGNQVGDAEYEPTKKGRDVTVADLKRKHKL